MTQANKLAESIISNMRKEPHSWQISDDRTYYNEFMSVTIKWKWPLKFVCVTAPLVIYLGRRDSIAVITAMNELNAYIVNEAVEAMKRVKRDLEIKEMADRAAKAYIEANKKPIRPEPKELIRVKGFLQKRIAVFNSAAHKETDFKLKQLIRDCIEGLAEPVLALIIKIEEESLSRWDESYKEEKESHEVDENGHDR